MFFLFHLCNLTISSYTHIFRYLYTLGHSFVTFRKIRRIKISNCVDVVPFMVTIQDLFENDIKLNPRRRKIYRRNYSTLSNHGLL